VIPLSTGPLEAARRFRAKRAAKLARFLSSLCLHSRGGLLQQATGAAQLRSIAAEWGTSARDGAQRRRRGPGRIR
jgi:hypothetical protein